MKIASAGSLNLSLFFIRDYSLSFAVHVGTACCALSFVMALISARIKRNVLKRDRSKIYVEEIEASSNTLNEPQCQRKGKVVPLNDTISSEKTPVDDQVNVKDLCTLNQTYWILFSISVTLYGSIFPFLNISQELFQSKWFPNNPEYAALAMSIPDIVAVFAVPLFGLLLDNYGHQSEMMPAAAAFVAVSHILTGFTDTSPFITMTIIGFGYSLFASSLWSSVPLLVGTHQIGTAYGILFCGLNLSLSLFPIAISLIQGKVSQGDYFLIQIFFIVLSGISFLFGVGLCTTMTYKNQLNNSLSKQQSNFDFTVEN
ncbi:major facilitator superfamily domain-containing protein [Globomyces pollinis-pini]|nr:major facilitator superfamily domain-containing protein [Globomyces pollinis-pini]